MKKLSFINTEKRNSGYRNLFQKDPNADFVIILKEKTYPLHRDIVKGIRYFQSIIKSNEKVHLIQKNFDNELFEQILGYFYGFDLSFERNAILFSVLQIVIFLGVKQIQEKIREDFAQNFQQYGIFCLMDICHKLNIEKIHQRCVNELIQLQFQQILINKFDLLQCQNQFFIRILVECLNLQIEQIIEGPTHEQLSKIIKQYNQLNKSNVNFQTLLKLATQKKPNKLREKIQKRLFRKRSSTWNCSHTMSEIPQKENKTPNKSNWYKNGSWDEAVKLNQSSSKKQQVFNLKMINNNLIKSNSALKHELQQCKMEFQTQNKNYSTQDDLDELKQRCLQFQRYSAIHDEKLANLQNEVCKFSESISRQDSGEKSTKQNDMFQQFFMDYKSKRLRKISEPCFLQK